MELNNIMIRKKIFNIIFFMFMSRTQIVEGITSRVNGDWDRHRILWDLDNCHLEDAYKALIKVAIKYDLGKIYIISDKNGSYGAVCNSVVSFKELIHILIDTDLIDPLYIRYTFQRKEAILRLSNKIGRFKDREIIGELNFHSDREEDNNDFSIVAYETGLSKKCRKFGTFIDGVEEND